MIKIMMGMKTAWYCTGSFKNSVLENSKEA